MNFKLKTRISILLCFVLIAFSIQPISVGAAPIGEPVPTDVSYWGFDENTTSSILNQGYNNILCLWDFENHEYLLVKCPDHMYYVPGGRVLLDGDYTGLFNKKDYQDYIRDQIVFNWGTEKGFFNLSASQYFTVYRVSEDGTLNSSEISEFNGIVNGTAWSASKTKYNALRWLYENDSDTYNLCNYALIWSTDSIDYAYTGSGNVSIDILNWANAVFMQNINYTAIYFTGGSTLNAAASDIPVYTFYPGGFNFTSPVAATPTPTPTVSPIQPWFSYPDLPSNFSSDTWCILKTHSDGFNDGQLIGIAMSGGYSVLNYPVFYKDRSPYNYRSQALIDNAITINTWLRAQYNFSVFSVNYDSNTDSYSVGSSLKSGFVSPGVDSWFTSVVFDWNGETLCSWSLVPNNDLSVTGSQAGTYANSPQSWFEILFTNHSKTPGFSENPNISATPTPSSSPTPTPYAPIYVSPTPSPEPSPGVTITPTQGPTDTSVKELRGWKGALQSILQTVFVGNTEAIEGYFNEAVGGYNIVENPFKQIVDSIYVDGSDQENFNPFENQQVDFVFDVHDQNGDILGGEHTANWRLTILPKTFWEWLKSYSNYFEVVFYLVDASFLGATMKRWLTKQNDEGSETKEGGDG